MDEVKNYLSGIEGINTWSLDDEIHGGTEVPESSKHGSMTCLNDEARKRTPMKHIPTLCDYSSVNPSTNIPSNIPRTYTQA